MPGEVAKIVHACCSWCGLSSFDFLVGIFKILGEVDTGANDEFWRSAGNCKQENVRLNTKHSHTLFSFVRVFGSRRPTTLWVLRQPSTRYRMGRCWRIPRASCNDYSDLQNGYPLIQIFVMSAPCLLHPVFRGPSRVFWYLTRYLVPLHFIDKLFGRRLQTVQHHKLSILLIYRANLKSSRGRLVVFLYLVQDGIVEGKS